MQATTDVKRVFVGKDVLGLLALMLLGSGLTASSLFVHVGELLAGAVAQLAPVLAADATAPLIVIGIYLQAVVLAAGYRVARGGYRTLQRRAKRAGSA
jgi:hypothetical protein